jgi:hypothetical protein
MRHLFFYCLLILLTSNVFGNTIQGIVVDENKKPIEFSNIILHKYTDSTYLNGTTTDSSGKFEITDLKPENYFLEIIYVGYKTDTIQVKSEAENENINIGTVELKVETNMLKGVEITSTKPIIERKADRIVYNVENSAKSSGENIMDLLRSVPGVTVSGNDEIRINGKSSIQVMINGKVEQLNADQLVNLLKSIQSSNVKKIEVVSNPSARYDASAKGGILEIQLKSNLRSGVNGSVYSNYRQHKYASTENGFNLNVNYKKFTMSTAYNFGYNRGWQHTTYVRDFTSDTSVQRFDEDGNDKDKFIAHFGNLNLKYNINDKNTIGIGGEIFSFRNPHETESKLNIYDNLSTSENVSSYQRTNNNSYGKSINPSVNFNFRSLLDTTGSKLEFSYDYTYFKLYTKTHLNTSYYDINDVEYDAPLDFTQENPYVVNLHTSKLDYSKPLKHNHSIEFGVKFTWTKTNNDIQFKNWNGSEYIKDDTRSNAFQYKENINAIYSTWSKEWKKGWTTNLGFRIEQTNTNQYSITLDTKTIKHYVDFFPSLFIQKAIKEDHSINLNYSRKIHRPNFEDLNPFEFYLSPYFIWTGNANLKPEYFNVTEITYTFKNAYSFFINHENIKNNYTRLVFQDDSSKISTYRSTNFKVRNNLNIGVNINKELFKWWTISYSAQYTFFKYNSVVNNSPFIVSSNKFSISMDNTFMLPKDFVINVFGFYTSPHLDATDIMKSDGMVNISVSKFFFKKTLKIQIRGNDIFGTKNFSYDTDFFNVHSKTRNKFASRWFGLTVTYNFQKGKKFQNTRVNKSNDDEKSRIH